MNCDKPTEPMTINHSLLKEIAIQLANYSVSFVELYEEAGQEHGNLIGSGTLVSVNEKPAILTAHHVLERLQGNKEIGLILGSMDRPQLHRFALKSFLIIRIARGDIESNGPDLGLLCILDIQTINSINAKKSFSNLSKRRDDILSQSISLDIGCVWFICGMVDEWTTDAPPEAGHNIINKFRGICDFGDITDHYERDDFDYLDFEVDEAFVIPKNFGGISGGGLWQVIFDKDHNGKPVVKDQILSGVAFYQSDLENDRRTIRCHGPQSIYGKVLDVLM